MGESENKRIVLVTAASPRGSLPPRLLDLQHILTSELQALSPTEGEILSARTDPASAMVSYADRIRRDYRDDAGGLREGFKRLSDSLASGRSIAITCACRRGEGCHSEIVKMALEKVHDHFQRRSESVPSQDRVKQIEPSRRNSVESFHNRHSMSSNPRTVRAISEIMGESRTEVLLGSINRTDGRSRSEHASFLGRSSQFVRELYEKGASIIGGTLIVPSEGSSLPRSVRVGSLEYAFKKLGRLLPDETRARELAPQIVEYGNKIAGSGADGETRVNVFGAIYSALDGRSEFLADHDRIDPNESKDERFERNLEAIRRLSEQMFLLEPSEIRIPTRSVEMDQAEQTADEREYEFSAGSPGFERIELPGRGFPRIPAGIDGFELEKLLESTLPELDRQLENGISVATILKPYRDRVHGSVRDDALNRLESIYRGAKLRELEERLAGGELTATKREPVQAEAARWQAAKLTPSQEQIREALLESEELGRLERSFGTVAPGSSEAATRLDELRERAVERRKAEGVETISQMSKDGPDAALQQNAPVEKIDNSKRLIISLSSPAEFHPALAAAEDRFYKQKKVDIAMARAEIADLRSKRDGAGNDRRIRKLQRDLGDIQEKTFSPSFRLENSTRIVTGEPSATALAELTFTSNYLKYQLRHPESRLRHENERYRAYAVRLENARDIDELVAAASSIRTENAHAGLDTKANPSNNRKEPAPLSANEMRFLFTETSPRHYTREMTATRLAFAQAGASRRAMAAALIKGEIVPGPDARKLIESLGSRLDRKELTDAIAATRHFFESIKTADKELRYKNDFDHRQLYQRLPPPEKDFVYFRAVHQKENLEYKLAMREPVRVPKPGSGQETRKPSAAETSFLLLGKFNQAHLLAERLGSVGIDSPEVSHHEFAAAAIVLNNNSADQTKSIANELIAGGGETRKVGEILNTFASAQTENFEDRMVIEITLPADRSLSVDSYRELLERFYPEDPRKNDKFKMTGFSLGLIEDAHVRGRDMVLENWKARVEPQAQTEKISVAERSVYRDAFGDLQAIRELQQAARGSVKENNAILSKYVARAAAIVLGERDDLPSPIEQRAIAVAAIGGRIGELDTKVPASKRFLKAMHDQISITDLRSFSKNQLDIDENVREIKSRMDNLSRSGILQETSPLVQNRTGSQLPVDRHSNDHSGRAYEPNGSERLAILKAGVKRDLINALGRRGIEIGTDLIDETKLIISRNLARSGIEDRSLGDHQTSEKLGREIAERIGVLAGKDKPARFAAAANRGIETDLSRETMPIGSAINSERDSPMRSADHMR